MRLFGNLVVRLIVVCLGYALAITAASLFLAFGYYREVFGGSLEYGSEFIVFDTLSIGAGTLYLSFVIARIALLPATIAIALCELMRWCSLTVYLVLGALCALFAAFGTVPDFEADSVSNPTLVILLACGFIAGFVYWLIAGSGSGSWMPAQKSAR